jgi:hypothetical protein
VSARASIRAGALHEPCRRIAASPVTPTTTQNDAAHETDVGPSDGSIGVGADQRRTAVAAGAAAAASASAAASHPHILRAQSTIPGPCPPHRAILRPSSRATQPTRPAPRKPRALRRLRPRRNREPHTELPPPPSLSRQGTRERRSAPATRRLYRSSAAPSTAGLDGSAGLSTTGIAPVQSRGSCLRWAARNLAVHGG